MMKKKFLLLLFLFVVLPVGAKVTFGVRAGLSYSFLSQLKSDDITYGGHLGYGVYGMLDIPFAKRFSIRPELGFVNQGGAYFVEYLEQDQIKFQEDQFNANYYSLQLPLNVVYKIPFQDWELGVYAGPFFSLSTRIKEFGRFGVREFHPFDMGAGAGIYVEHQRVSFSVYSHSGFFDRLTRKEPHESQVYQNNVLFSFGYFFK